MHEQHLHCQSVSQGAVTTLMKALTRARQIAQRNPECAYNHRTMRGYLCALVLGMTAPAQAHYVYFTGELVKVPSCTIHEGKVIDVPFGQNIAVSKLDGVNYRQTLDYGIKCGATTLEWSMSLKISGPVTSFNPAALQTSVDGLGIEILQNGVPLILDRALTIDPKNPPTLQAVPVKDPNIELMAEGFNATATLTAEYQ